MKAILFESDYDPVAADRKQRKSNARIYDSMPVRFWKAWLDEKKPHIFIQDLREGAHPVDVLKGSKLAESPGFGGVFNPLAGGQPLHLGDVRMVARVGDVEGEKRIRETPNHRTEM